jgi:nicotinic acid phosphoribosyltransferase
MPTRILPAVSPDQRSKPLAFVYKIVAMLNKFKYYKKKDKPPSFEGVIDCTDKDSEQVRQCSSCHHRFDLKNSRSFSSRLS